MEAVGLDEDIMKRGYSVLELTVGERCGIGCNRWYSRNSNMHCSESGTCDRQKGNRLRSYGEEPSNGVVRVSGDDTRHKKRPKILPEVTNRTE
jgi:hypothetical protein